CTENHHKDLFVGDMSHLIHLGHGIQHSNNLWLVKKWQRTENWAAQHVLHHGIEPSAWVQGSWRTPKWLFGPAEYSRSNDFTHRLPQDVLMSSAANLLANWQRAGHFDNVVIQKRQASFDGIGHFHAVPEYRQKIIG